MKEFVRERDTIDFEAMQFKANGKTYYIEPRLTTNRLFAYNEFQMEYSIRGGAKFVFDSAVEIHELTKSGNDLLANLHKIGAISHNLAFSIKMFEDLGIDAAYKFLCLFCNTEDEDITEWSDSLMKRKIADWRKTDIPYDVFFSLSNNLFIGLLAISKARKEMLNNAPKDKFLINIMEQSNHK